jgi:hypothetical protein
MVKKYGQTVMLTEDPALETYLDRILKQVNSAYAYIACYVSNGAILAWLLKGNVTQLVLVLLSKDTRTPLERWTFNVDLVAPTGEGSEPYIPGPGFPSMTSNHLLQCALKVRGRNPKRDTAYYQANRGLSDFPTTGVRADRVQHPRVHQ